MSANYSEINGDLINLALESNFDVIAHGCNCFCKMKSGIAKRMAEIFGCDKFPFEDSKFIGNINKLGCINFKDFTFNDKPLTVVNAYTQFKYGKNHSDGQEKPVDYDAIRLCMRKINYQFKGKTIGLPKIGAGLAGGSWEIISQIIKEELKDCIVIIVIFENN